MENAGKWAHEVDAGGGEAVSGINRRFGIFRLPGSFPGDEANHPSDKAVLFYYMPDRSARSVIANVLQCRALFQGRIFSGSWWVEFMKKCARRVAFGISPYPL